MSKHWSKQTVQFFILALGLFLSGLGLVYVKYENRVQFRQWQQLVDARDQLDVEWGRLQLELGAWSTHAQVESLARERLHMKTPTTKSLVIVRHE